MAEQVESVSILYVEQNGVLGGYRNVLLKEEVPSFFRSFVTCNRCEGIMREASGVGDPQVFICETCAQGERIFPLPANREVINNLIIWCPLKSRGCEWEGHISSSETHLDTCDYLCIECESLCGAVVKRIDMESHVSEECPYHVIKCEHCTQSIKQTDMNIHLGECVMFPLHCTNECGDVLHRGDMQSHRDEVCPNSLLACAYRKYGCGVELTRKDLDTHTKDYRLQHMEMLMKSGINNLKEELDRVKEENNSIYSYIDLIKNENMSHRNAVYATSDEYATLRCELVSLRNSTNEEYNRAEINHNALAVDSYKAVVDKIEKIVVTNTFLETELTCKISPNSLVPLTAKCKDLEYLTLFQEKRTFKLSRIFLRKLKRVSDIWEGIRTDPIRLLRINHEPVYIDGGSMVVRLTGVYSISTQCNATISLCVVLMNYNHDTVENTYCFSVLVKPEITRTISDLTIQTYPRKPQRYEKMYILADIPNEDIQKEGVCHMDCINIQLCYDRVIGDSM